MQTLFMSAAIPLTAGFVYLLIAGYYEFKTYRVPNKLTYSAIGLAFLFAFVAGMLAPERSGSFVSAFVGMLLGGALLFPFYSKGFLGAGCVKAQGACGAWVGAGFAVGTCIKLVLISTIVAAIVGTICFGITYAKRKHEAQPNLYADLNATERDFLSAVHGQMPLSIGTMIGLVLASLV